MEIKGKDKGRVKEKEKEGANCWHESHESQLPINNNNLALQVTQ